MARSVNFKKPDTTLTGNIPELNGLGLIKVKDTTGQTQNVTSLYVNDGSVTPQLIWQPTTVSQTTNESTQPPVGPCDNQPVCPDLTYESLLHYPLIPNTTERWDCAKWKLTGNAVDLVLNTTISNNIALNDPDSAGTGQYARVYNFNGPTPLPPPPGYVVLDFLSFSVADRIAVYINKNIEAPASVLYSLTNSDPSAIQVLFPNRTAVFNSSHGNLSNTSLIYSLAGCDCSSGTCLWEGGGNGGMPLCDLDPAGAFPICSCEGAACGDGCDCYGVVPSSSEGQPPTCKTLDEMDTFYTNFIVDTSCIATTEGCKTVCYGRPAPAVNGDATPSGEYVCRYVGKVPNIVTGSNTSGSDFGIQASNMYNAAYTLRDFAITNNAGCRPEDCPSELPPCPSAWKTKIFLPFYVNLPDVKYPSGSGLSSGALTDASSSLNLKGKYVEIIKEKLDNINSTTFYDGHPILKTIQNLLNGKIRSCSAILSFPWDFSSEQTSSNITFWALTEYPRQISAGLPSHTHQLVIEFTNPNRNQCGLCINTAFGVNASTKIAHIRFYPITDTAGNLLSPFNNFATGLNAVVSPVPFTAQQAAIYSIRFQHHPVLGQFSEGDLFSNNTSLFTTANAGNDNTAGDAFYLTNITGLTQNYKLQTVSNPTNQLSLVSTLNKIQQIPINATSVTPVDCQCTQI
jgi:hypothetical protein